MDSINIVKADNYKLKSKFIDFIYEVYKDIPQYKDTLSLVTKNFLFQKDSFAKRCSIHPVMILMGSSVVAECVFIYNKALPSLQMGFFEALPGYQDAVDMLIQEGKSLCRALGLNKIIIGLNGHFSYGIGLLADNFDQEPAFDSIYNPPYYREYFRKYNGQEVLLSSYKWDMKDLKFDYKVLGRVYKNFSFRTMNMKEFKKEIYLLSELNNECLKNVHFHFWKQPQEDYELIKNLRFFLNKENLIFVLKDGKEVGFLFWHPDYNQMLKGCKKSNPLKIFLRFLFFRNKINRFVINTFGVLPKYQGSGAIAGLFHQVYTYAVNTYKYGESTFVLQDNIKSRRISERFVNPYKTYVVFELDV